MKTTVTTNGKGREKEQKRMSATEAGREMVEGIWRETGVIGGRKSASMKDIVHFVTEIQP